MLFLAVIIITSFPLKTVPSFKVLTLVNTWMIYDISDHWSQNLSIQFWFSFIFWIQSVSMPHSSYSLSSSFLLLRRPSWFSSGLLSDTQTISPIFCLSSLQDNLLLHNMFKTLSWFPALNLSWLLVYNKVKTQTLVHQTRLFMIQLCLQVFSATVVQQC